MIRYLLALGVALALSAPVAHADEPPPIKLLLTPAKPPTPALRYRLLPDARETISGDAVPIYRQAIELLKKTSYREKAKQFDDWLALPLDKLPRDEVRKTLAEYDGIYELLDKAARHEQCAWGFLGLVREKGI